MCAIFADTLPINVRSSNYIALIEAYYPPKQQVLAFYNGTGARPSRAARVVLSFGGRTTPTVENLIVSPLPISTDTRQRFLEDIYHRPVIPHNARMLSPREFIRFHVHVGHLNCENSQRTACCSSLLNFLPAWSPSGRPSGAMRQRVCRTRRWPLVVLHLGRSTDPRAGRRCFVDPL